MRVLINGAGIGGLATALTLRMRLPFVEVSVLERNTSPPAGKGAGLNIQPHGVETLQKLDLMDDAIINGWSPRFQRYYTASGQLIGESARGLEADPDGYPQVSIHRATLHRVLEEAVKDRLGPNAIQRGVQGVSYTQDERGVNLKCIDSDKNAVHMQADVVIGADGIHSKIRQEMLKNRGIDEGSPIRSDIRIYRGTSMMDEILDGDTVLLAGRSNGKLVCYPLEAPKHVKDENGIGSNKVLTNFVVEVDETRYPMKESDKPMNKDELADRIAFQLEDVNDGKFYLPFLDHRELFRRAYSIEPFPMVDRDPLDSWCDGRVVLLGDAAHAMYPVGSNGASSALLDADEIASSLTSQIGKKGTKHFNHDDICHALQNYESIRRPVTTSVQAACREMLPEQVMDRVQKEVPLHAKEIPQMYETLLQDALSKCQAGTVDDLEMM